MTLAADAFYTTKPTTVLSVPVASGATIYDGALCMAATTTGGPAKPYDGTIGAILLGWNFGDVEDDGTASPTKTAKIARGGFTIIGLAVTGLGGSQIDIGKKVYAVLTDNGYTVTSNTTHQVHVGHVLMYNTTGICDVKMLEDIFGTVGV